MFNRSLEDIAFQLMEEDRIGLLKKLGKTEFDYDSILDTVPVSEIEKYLRQKKLKNIKR